MIYKLLLAIATILIIFMSIFVILKVNSEEKKNNLISDVNKFVGQWMLINTEEYENPDTSEDTDTFVDYETYEFLSNGTYYHVVDEDNISGIWEINNSMLVLTVDEEFGVLPVSYEYVFSDDNNRVTLNFIGNPENFLEFEKISV